MTESSKPTVGLYTVKTIVPPYLGSVATSFGVGVVGVGVVGVGVVGVGVVGVGVVGAGAVGVGSALGPQDDNTNATIIKELRIKHKIFFFNYLSSFNVEFVQFLASAIITIEFGTSFFF